MEHKEFVLGWGTLSLIIAGIAQGKNRSGLGWWLIGLVLGPIGLLVLLFVDTLPAESSVEDRIVRRIRNEIDDRFRPSA
jgi:hypothetical protein